MKVVRPNVRKMFLPEPGYIILEADLPQADLRVVAWDADDTELMDMFDKSTALQLQGKTPVDAHAENAKKLYNNSLITKKTHFKERQAARVGVHAANYLSSAATLATNLSKMEVPTTIHMARDFIQHWFKLHPKIQQWHKRLSYQLQTTRQVKNVYGYRRYYFDRIEQILPEAVAWIPQSTVALAIDEVIDQLETMSSDLFISMQVHDSCVFQVPIPLFEERGFKVQLIKVLTVSVPYPRPLVMHCELKGSTISWGHAEELKLPYE